MKKITALVLALLLLAVSSCAMADHLDEVKKSGKLVVGAEVSFAPFEFYMTDENGKEYEAGFEMDLARQIAADLGVELEIADQQFNGLITALQVGEVDLVISGMTATEERRNAVDFSDTYYNASQSIIVPADSTIATKEDLKGKSVGGQTGTTGLTVAAEICGEQNVRGYNNAMLAVQDLVNGNLDAVVIDNAPAKVLANKYSTTKLIDGQFDAEEYVLAVKKGDSELLGKINGALKELMASGKVDEIISNYIDDQGDQSADADVAPEK